MNNKGSHLAIDMEMDAKVTHAHNDGTTAAPNAAASPPPASSPLPPEDPRPTLPIASDHVTIEAVAPPANGDAKADSNNGSGGSSASGPGPGGTLGVRPSNPPAPLVRVPTASSAAPAESVPAFKSALRSFLLGFLVVSALVVTLTQVLEIRSVLLVHQASSTLREENARGTVWQISVLHDRVVSAESSARGFVITGQPHFLTRYNESVANASHHYGEILRSLPASQHALMDSVHTLYMERIALLDTTIATRKREGFNLTLVTAQVLLGEQTMTNLTTRLAALYSIAQTDRTNMLDELHLASTWIRFTAISTLIGTVILLIVGVGGALTFSERELRARNLVLQDLLQKAQSAALLKADFLTNISHEIRTPMNGVLAMCHVLLHTPLSSEQRECLDTVLESANSMMRLINDLLLCSRLGAGQFALNPQPVKIARLLKHIHDTMKVRVRAAAHDPAKGPIEWKIEQDAALPSSIIVDADRVKQVLLNLCDNALKFTSTGSIVLAVRLRNTAAAAASKSLSPQANAATASAHAAHPTRPGFGSQPSSPATRTPPKDECKETALSVHDSATPKAAAGPETVAIEFSVKDTGIGIAGSALANIFEAFSQADMSMTKKYSGQGLGLTVCRQLISEMGSELRVQSQEGQGSRFWFTITVPLFEGDPTDSPTGTGTEMGNSPGPSPAFNSVMARVQEEDDAVCPLPAQEAADPSRRSTLTSSTALSYDDTVPTSVHTCSQPGSMLDSAIEGQHRRRVSGSSLQFFSPQCGSALSTSRTLRDIIHLADCTCTCASVGNASYASVQLPAAAAVVGLPTPPQRERRTESSVITPPDSIVGGSSVHDSCGSISHNLVGGGGWINDLSSFSIGSQLSSSVGALEGQSRYSRAQSCPDWASFNPQMESMRSQFNRTQSQLFTPPAPSRKHDIAASWTPNQGSRPCLTLPPPISIASSSSASSNDSVSRTDAGYASSMLPVPAFSMLHGSRSSHELTMIRQPASTPSTAGRSPNASPPVETTPMSASAALPKGRPLRILCAEDNLVNQKVMLKLLSREGHTTVMTDDGLQAVQQFEQHSPDYFDLVLLDMCMPVMDGVTACQRIRDMEQQRRQPHSATYSMPSPPLAATTSPVVDSRTSATSALSASPTCPRIPIVAVTASALLEDKQVCVQAGMDDVIVKPLTPVALRAVLKPIRNRINQSAAGAPPPLMFPVSAMQALRQAQAAQTQAAQATQMQASQTGPAEPVVPSTGPAAPSVLAPAPVAASSAATVVFAPTDVEASAAAEPRPMASRPPGVHRTVSADAVLTPRRPQQLAAKLPRAASAISAYAQFPVPAAVAPVQPLLSSDSPPPPPQQPAYSPPHASPHASPPPPHHIIALLSSAFVNTPPSAAGTEE